MKKLFLAIACFFVQNSFAEEPQNVPEPEVTQEEATVEEVAAGERGNVTLEFTDGTTRRGWPRTEMKNEVRFFEISDEPRGERVRYDSDLIERIVFDDGSVYLKRDIAVTVKTTNYRNYFVRVEYEGSGIALYSAYVEHQDFTGMIPRTDKQTNYYISLADGPAVWASIAWHSRGTMGAAAANRSMLNYYFSRRYPEYAEFAKRIKAKEFDTTDSPMEVIRAWEEAFGGVSPGVTTDTHE